MRPAVVDTLAVVAAVVDTPRAVAIPAVAVTKRRYKQRVYGQVAVNEVKTEARRACRAARLFSVRKASRARRLQIRVVKDLKL